jgi:4a-hydroxytetrahydrobiopterin dehydratase
VTVPEPLSDDEIATELAGLDGWTRQGDEITKTFSIEYHAGIPMIVEVARTAKEVGHHPDILRKWDTVAFTVTTHDAGYKITDLDFDLARRIDDIAAAHGAGPTIS